MNKTRLLLWVSLGLNLLLAGFWLGGLFHPPLPPFLVMQRIMDRMPEHGRAVLRDAFEEMKTRRAEERQAIDAARRKLSAAIAAPILDDATVEKAAAEMHQMLIQSILRDGEKMRGLLKQLTPEERRLLAEHVLDAPLPPMP